MKPFDVLGAAIEDYYKNNATEAIVVHETGEEDDLLEPAYFFRLENELPELEKVALSHCQGKVLDVGAGAGSHTLILQERNYAVSAIDISAQAVSVMQARGVKQVQALDFFKLKNETFDTILLLMNGIGIAGTLSGLDAFFIQLKSLLDKGGAVITESCDLLHHASDEERWEIISSGKYFGELEFQMEYKKRMGTPFNWLFIDIHNLRYYAQKNDFDVEVLFEDGDGAYLAKITLKKMDD